MAPDPQPSASPTPPRTVARPVARTKPAGAGRRRGLKILGVIVLVLLAVQFGGGAIAKFMLNRKLAQMEGYTAHVGAVRLALWRGGADVKDFVLSERDKPGEPPLVRVQRATLSAALRPLLHGKLGGEGLIEDVDLVFAKHHAFDGPVDAADKLAREAEEKKEQAKRWQALLQKAVPMEIERFEMRNARIRYLDRSHQPNVDVGLRDVRLVLTGLQNHARTKGAELPTQLDMTGISTGNGQMKLHVTADPAAQPLRFDVAFELRGVSLPELNNFLRAYASADVSQGRFELYSEIKAQNGGYNGYVKPFFEQLNFKNVTDRNKSFIERTKEKVVSAAASILKNDEEQKVATAVPFSGTFEQGDADVWEAIHNLLRNAFVQALREGLDGQKPTS